MAARVSTFCMCRPTFYHGFCFFCPQPISNVFLASFEQRRNNFDRRWRISGGPFPHNTWMHPIDTTAMVCVDATHCTEHMYRSSPLRSTLNTNVITGTCSYSNLFMLNMLIDRYIDAQASIPIQSRQRNSKGRGHNHRQHAHTNWHRVRDSQEHSRLHLLWHTRHNWHTLNPLWGCLWELLWDSLSHCLLHLLHWHHGHWLCHLLRLQWLSLRNLQLKHWELWSLRLPGYFCWALMTSLAIIQKCWKISLTNIGNHFPHVAVVPRLYGTVSIQLRCSIPKQKRLNEFNNWLKDNVANVSCIITYHHWKNLQAALGKMLKRANCNLVAIYTHYICFTSSFHSAPHEHP